MAFDDHVNELTGITEPAAVDAEIEVLVVCRTVSKVSVTVGIRESTAEVEVVGRCLIGSYLNLAA